MQLLLNLDYCYLLCKVDNMMYVAISNDVIDEDPHHWYCMFKSANDVHCIVEQ